MRSVTVRHRTLSDQPDRRRRRGRLPLPSIPLVLLMLATLSMSAYSKDPEDSTPKIGGHTFSSDLRLYVLVFRETGGEWELIGKTPSV